MAEGIDYMYFGDGLHELSKEDFAIGLIKNTLMFEWPKFQSNTDEVFKQEKL